MLRRYHLPILLGELVLAVLFSIFVFAFGTKEIYGNPSFIIAYIFMFLAIIIGAGVIFLVNFKKQKEDSINDAPYFYIGNIVLFLAYIFLAALNILIKPEKTTLTLVLVFSILVIYAAYTFLMIHVVIGQGKDQEHVKQKVRYIRFLESDILSASECLDDEETQKILTELAHDIRNSDPMSDASLQGIENQIFSLAGEVREFAEKKENEEVKAKAAEISRLLKERNRKCMMLK